MIPEFQSPWMEADPTARFLPVSPLGSPLHGSHALSSLLFGLGTATWTSLGLSPCRIRGPASGSWLDSEGQAEPAWGGIAVSS